MQKLDEKCSELMQVVRKKGGAIREKTRLLTIVEKHEEPDMKTRISDALDTFFKKAAEELKLEKLLVTVQGPDDMEGRAGSWRRRHRCAAANGETSVRCAPPLTGVQWWEQLEDAYDRAGRETRVGEVTLISVNLAIVISKAHWSGGSPKGTGPEN
ncbi:hypothetical protein F2P81_005991 [Scophthalmus maximus]|uniref:Uncharacterized protein n=1 Tax=Scophthalmus maximus TaxID=52904 RepID=A0A6A4TC67_SCOMX|nr:hypothetical protein F2P81_005991 [Scophthalmus maximus]